jgi:hypothetical protein
MIWKGVSKDVCRRAIGCRTKTGTVGATIRTASPCGEFRSGLCAVAVRTGATISAFTRVSVRPNGESDLGDDDDQFRNLLCAQISKEVGLVTVRDAKSFDLTFNDGSGVSISLKPEDYAGPEAVAVNGDGYFLVL